MTDPTSVATAWMDRAWDPEAHLLWNPPGAFDDVTDGPHTVHLVRETAWYALGLLRRGARATPPEQREALVAVCDHQYDAPGQPWHGTFVRFPEWPPPQDGAVEWVDYDPNWRQFLGTALAVAVTDFALPRGRGALSGRHRPGDRGRATRPGPADLRQHRAAARLAGGMGRSCRPVLRGVGGRRVPSPRLLHRARLPDLLRRRPAGARAVAASRRAGRAPGVGRRDRGGPVDRHRPLVAPGPRQPVRSVQPRLRHGPARLRQRPRSGALVRRPAGAAPRPRRRPAPPRPRPVHGPAAAARRACGCPTTCGPAFDRFTGPHAVEQVVDADRARIATGWLDDDRMVGAESGASGLHARGQFHPATVHWRLPSGGVGWLRLVHHAPTPRHGPPGGARGGHGPPPAARPGPLALGVQRRCRRGRPDRWSFPGLEVSVTTDATLLDPATRTYAPTPRLTLTLH